MLWAGAAAIAVLIQAVLLTPLMVTEASTPRTVVKRPATELSVTAPLLRLGLVWAPVPPPVTTNPLATMEPAAEVALEQRVS